MAKKAKKKAPAKRKPAKKAKEMLLVGSKTKLALKGSGKNTLNISADALDALNEKVYQLIEEARTRTVENKRKTVKSCDI